MVTVTVTVAIAVTVTVTVIRLEQSLISPVTGAIRTITFVSAGTGCLRLFRVDQGLLWWNARGLDIVDAQIQWLFLSAAAEGHCLNFLCFQFIL